MLRWGPDHGPVVVMALPMLEEANRVRAFAVAICRALAERGVASALPDLPGTGESSGDAAGVSLGAWREAFATAARHAGTDRATHGAAIRSGALFDGDAKLDSRWRFAAQEGERALREWRRIVDTAAREAGAVAPRPNAATQGEVIDVAGHRVSGTLLAELADAVTDPSIAAPCRDVRLEGDPGNADTRVAGAPLWRRAEPSNDLALAQVLADDIAQWIRTCEGC